MKIAIVNSFYSSTRPSGENNFVEQLAETLKEFGHEVIIISRKTDDMKSSLVYKVGSAITVATGLGASPINELLEFAPDVVHIHNLFPNWGTSWLTHWKGPIVTTIHNFRPMCAAGTFFRDGKVCLDCLDKSPLSGVYNACYRDSRLATLPLTIQNRGGLQKNRLLERSQCVVFASAKAMELYISNGLDREKCEFLPGTVTDFEYNPEEPIGAEWVYIGRLSEEKGIISLIENWPDGIPITIYGEGPLKSQVEESPNSSISFGGILDSQQVNFTLKKSRGLIFPSECFEGGTPLVYLEALAAGRAVIALSGNSVAADIQDKGTGFVFNAWGELHQLLCRNVNEYEAIGRKNRTIYTHHYSHEAFATSHQKIYEEAKKSYFNNSLT